MALNPPPSAYVDATGIHVPTLADYLTWLVSEYQGRYGADVYLAEDSQDGQWLGIMAYAFQQQAAAAVTVYNQFSPTTAIGTGLSSIVKVNGISRQVSTNSTVDLDIGGTVGTTITNGIVSDGVNPWVLPSPITIPPAGVLTVTAVCVNPGAQTANPNTITSISTPTSGWQSVTNRQAAVPGSPVEQDGALKSRQIQSTMLPSQGPLDGLIGGILSVPGVTGVTAFENDDDVPDATGINPRSLAFVVDGGDATAIATVIASKKGQGVGLMGTTEVAINNAAGVPKPIRFYRKTPVVVSFTVYITPKSNYTQALVNGIANALAAYANNAGTGQSLSLFQAIGAAVAIQPSTAYEITGLTMSRAGAPMTAADVPIAFFETATSALTNVYFVTAPPS